MGNRRQQKRVPLASVALLGRPDGEGPKDMQTFTADISMSGIGLYSTAVWELDRDVSIDLTFMGTETLITEHLEGRIIYANRIGAIYFLGVQFQEEVSAVKQPGLYERLQRILSYY